MSHRAQQIVDAIAAALVANTSLGASVYTHRMQSLSDEDQELPAVSVTYGADTPVGEGGVENTVFIDSLLEVFVSCFARHSSESELLTSLLELRRQAHIALQANPAQGLSFVSDTQYAGADAPVVSANGERMDGALSTRWLVRYRMNITDPG